MTLKDIAEKAGVSTMTVSNVINKRYGHVSAKTIEKIEKIIQEYHYVPNLSARSLTNKTSNIIGILVSENTASPSFLENPYAGTIIGTLEQTLKKHGYYTMLRSITKKEDLLYLIKNWHVDGIVFLYPEKSEFLDTVCRDTECPVAVFDSDTQNSDIINVCSDDFRGLYLSTEHLIQKGHSRIAFAADYRENPLLSRRFYGYRQALKDYGIPFSEASVIFCAPTYEGGITAGAILAGKSPSFSGVVTTSDLCAVGIIEGCRRNRLQVPHDISVIGYDNSSVCNYTFPALTSISQNMQQKAETAADLLLEKINTGKLAKSHFQLLPVELIVRASTTEN